jgi:NADPH:quinone reductase-like Zn-dependent oxidoreductase
MKAIQFHEAGGPEVLQYDEVPVPEIGPGEVLVRVHAAGINPPDWYLREGMKVMPAQMRPALEFPPDPRNGHVGRGPGGRSGRAGVRRR